MNFSWRIARIAGTDVKIHSTFVLALAFYVWQGYQDGGTAQALITGGFVLVLFGCVLLHEFGHIAMARHFGVRTPDVLLLPIGGMARLERMPEEPIQELLIAVAGPAVTLAIAFGIYLYIAVTSTPPSLREMWDGADTYLSQVMALNWKLLAFNFIPAIPMDGGRVLRSLLSMRLGHQQATRIATRVGKTLAVGLGLFGLFHTPPNIILVLIATFVYFAASVEQAGAERSAADTDVPLSTIMLTEFLTIPVHTRLGIVADQVRNSLQHEFPVVDNFGHLEGLFTRNHLIHGLTALGPQGTVGESMASGVPSLSPELPFRSAFGQLQASGLPALPVVNGAGAVVGVLSLDLVRDLMLAGRLRRN